MAPVEARWPIDNPPEPTGGSPVSLIAHPQEDGNGVDVPIGAYTTSATDVVIGQPGAGGLAYSRSYVGGGWRADGIGTISHSGASYSVSMGGGAETFTKSGSVFSSDGGTGSTLTEDGSGFVYTTGDGTVFTFVKSLANEVLNNGEDAVLTSAAALSGATTTFHYNTATVSTVTRARLQSVTNSFGYQLHLTYADDAPANTTELHGDWVRVTKVTAINNAEDYCSPTANICSGLSYSWPEVTYTGETHEIATATDPEGRTTTYTYDGNDRLWKVQYPGSSVVNLTVSYDGSGRVTSINRGYATWSYAYSDNTGTDERTTTITLPGGGTQVTVTDISDGTIKSVTDPLSRTTSYLYDSSSRVTRVTAPEGNYVSYSYDSRGNRTETRMVAKSGSGLSDLVTSATYASTCSNIVTCNKPETTTDVLGKVTTYTYDSTHGGLTSVKAPDPDGVGSLVAPESRLFYAQKQARYKNSSSTFANGASTYVLEKTAACATSAFSGAYNASAAHANNNCGGGTADKTVTETDWPTTASANNLQPEAVTAEAGDASVASTTSFTYNRWGWPSAVDGPLAGSADTVVTFYNDAGQVRGSVTPDPDGGGALANQAVRTVFNSSGLPYRIETGTAAGQSEANFDAMTVLQKAETTYDDYFRPVKSVAYSGATSTVLAVTQVSYDSAGRRECAAQRMNPSIFASLPGSACSLGTSGAYGNDRISKAVYNYASEVTKQVSAYGTGRQQDTVTTTFTSNGLVATVTDANGNKTTYTYDGHDRLKKVCFPSKTTAGTSSSTDCEEYFYTSAGLLDKVRPRKGSIASAATWDVSFSYDDLGRATQKVVPGDGTHTFAYDSFGRLTNDNSGVPVYYDYDQLGRLTEQSHAAYGSLAIGFDYDAAGRVTTLTYPNGFEVDYAYDVLGRPISAVDGDANTIATVAYDNYGRRASLTYGNGTDVAYDYDGLGRLDELDWDLAGTSSDVSYDFTFNPAAQTISETVSNSAYNYALPDGFVDDYVANGLNQYTSVDGTSVTHDDNGNITTDHRGRHYVYDAENKLLQVQNPDTSTLKNYAYYANGLLRLATYSQRFYYWGDQEIIEYYDPAPLVTDAEVTRLYVRLPGSVDEPILMIDYTNDELVDSFSLPADSATPTASAVLQNGVSYTVTVSGDVVWWPPHQQDAEYYTWDNWSTQNDVWSGDDVGVSIDGVDIDWGAYSPDHIYQTTIIGDGTSADFLIYDQTYGDNTGAMSVTIEKSGPVRVWAHQNRQGSVIATSDSLGNVIDQYTYSPYGESGPEGDGGFPFRFTGQKLDATTGLYYYKARWYDPEVGRFMQTDPIGYGDGMNMYAYTGGDPVNGRDPTGLKQSTGGGGGGSGNGSSWCGVTGCTLIYFDGGGFGGSSGLGYSGGGGGVNSLFNASASSGSFTSAPHSGSSQGLSGGSVSFNDNSLHGITGNADIRVANAANGLNLQILVLEAQGVINQYKGFLTPDEAATEILNIITPVAEKFGLEVGGNILPRSNGTYRYTLPKAGGRESVMVSTSAIGYHTHPYTRGALLFSNYRYNALGGIGGGNDVLWVERSGRPLYLGVFRLSGTVSIGVCEPGVCTDRYVPHGTPPSRVLQ